MRQIILDTETTGLEPQAGHRIIEIGGVELIDRRFTGNNFQQYINPERDIEKDAISVHGITSEFLADKPLFSDIMSAFIEYITGAELIIHNAPFDVGFLNHEFRLTDPKAKLIEKYASVFDTLALARKKHPGKKNSLDALCKRYNVDNSKREFHGALLDAHLLADVYLIMTGGQMSMFGGDGGATLETKKTVTILNTTKERKSLKVIRAAKDEEQAHQLRLAAIKKASGKCLWQDVMS